MKTNFFIAAIFLFSLIFSKTIFPCTTFLIKTDDELVFGRNYDFMIGYGIVFVNKKNVVKTAFSETNKPAEWVSKYGSLTFNQYGREFPTGGMNEAGLVVELMWLDGTKYPEPDDRPATGGILQWIQYQLDNCETIQEVIDTDKDLRIPNTAVPIHFLISDKYGNSATIEFLNGKLVAHQGENLPFPVLTNDTYQSSIEYFNSDKETSGIQSMEDQFSSLKRFAKACTMVKDYNKESDGNAIDYGFKILGDVAQGAHTKWSIVYDIKNMNVYFKTYDSEKIKIIDFASLDFNCATPVKMVDINTDLEGNINQSMTDYSFEANRKLIEDSYEGVDFLKSISDQSKDLTASYPEKLNCRSKSSIENNPGKFEGGHEERKFPNELMYLLYGVILTSVIFTGYKIRKSFHRG